MRVSYSEKIQTGQTVDRFKWVPSDVARVESETHVNDTLDGRRPRG